MQLSALMYSLTRFASVDTLVPVLRRAPFKAGTGDSVIVSKWTIG